MKKCCNADNHYPIMRRAIKHDKKFMEHCSVYNLPCFWKDQKKMYSKKKVSQFVKRYENIKKKMIDETVTLNKILELENITENERNELMESYSIMNTSRLEEYLRIKKNLNRQINVYKTYSKESLEQKIEEEKQKNEYVKKKTIEADNLLSKILKFSADDNTMRILLKKYDEFAETDSCDDNHYKTKKWIDTVLALPFNKTCKTYEIYKNENRRDILYNIKQELDKKLYGMSLAKENILMMLNNKIYDHNSENNSLALLGPPGVGKTQLIRSLAEILNVPFVQISMGGVTDYSFLEGHSYTYVGSQPGKIVDALTKMQCNNGILFFDEIDKISDTPQGQSVTNQLLHITDFTQNSQFVDKYLSEIHIDLSKIWFVFSMNNLNSVDPILRNRLNVINVDGYSNKDKKEILKKYLIPNMKKQYGLQQNYIFTDDNIEYIIKNTNSEHGIRDLKRNMEDIFLKIKFLDDINYDKSFNLSYYNNTELKKDEDGIYITNDYLYSIMKKSEKSMYSTMFL